MIVTHPLGPEDNPRLFRLFGAVFGASARPRRLSPSFDAALAELDAAVATLPRERVLYLIWRKPWMTVARDTYIGATLARAGWDTVPARPDRRYPELADDDAGVARRRAHPACRRSRTRSAPATRRRCRAARGRPAHLVDGEMTSWYGPRAIAGLRYLASLRRSLATGDG